MPRPVRFVAALVCVAAAAGRAHAADPDLEALVGGPSTCPRAELVLAELATLLPPDRLSTRLRALTGTPAVELIDLGAPFQVVVGGRVREYRDEARDCAQRARVAAVFVAMTIDPASIAAPPPPPPPPPPAAAPGAPPGARLGVAAAVDSGLGSSGVVVQGGLDLRLAAGRRPVAFVAGALLLWPVDTTVGGVRLHETRFPIDAGVRLERPTGGGAAYADLGLHASVLSVTATDLATANSRTTIELGARAALGMRFGGARLAWFAAAHAVLVPAPAAIYALPQGVAGHTPYVWIGGSAGAAMGFL